MQMSARSGGAVRHGIGVSVQAVLITAIAALVALAFSPLLRPAASALGLGTANASGSWIALRTGTSLAATQPALGSAVAFDAGYPKTVKTPRISVRCFQNDVLVYGEAGPVDQDFLLGGGSSDWLRAGGPASCVADLFFYSFNRHVQTYNWLASTAFDAAG